MPVTFSASLSLRICGVELVRETTHIKCLTKSCEAMNLKSMGDIVNIINYPKT